MSNKTALVTGASRGLGRGIAVQLAKEGYDIAVHYVGNAEAAGETARLCQEIGVQAGMVQADVADYGQGRQSVEAAIVCTGLHTSAALGRPGGHRRSGEIGRKGRRSASRGVVHQGTVRP